MMPDAQNRRMMRGEMFGSVPISVRNNLMGVTVAIEPGLNIPVNVRLERTRDWSGPALSQNFPRAQVRLMPDDEDLLHNLQLAGSIITDKIDPAPRLFLWDWWEGLKADLPLRTATWVAYACFVLLLGAVALLLVGRTYRVRSIALWGTAGLVLVSGVALVLLLAKIGDIRRTDEAVVMQQVVTAKNSPDAKSTDAFVIHAGLKVQVVDQVGGWLKIRLADGKVGWIESGGIERI